MLYEYRVYEAMPGRLPALNARFRNTTLGFFEKHGIKVVGFWEALVGTSNELHYLLAFEDMGHRERAWAAFGADPGWASARAETEKDGPLVARIRNAFWRPTDYSPLK
ncbi:MAG: NIPSNAP family protein [Chloroflexi bacterium]|nr:NIPSNAP family protein [Chloroflexota bacterium]